MLYYIVSLDSLVLEPCRMSVICLFVVCYFLMLYFFALGGNQIPKAFLSERKATLQYILVYMPRSVIKMEIL